MKERKNIDRLFQEKFKNFEAHPSDRVWENILSAKAKKENRKIAPLWLRLGGIAAALAILFTVGTIFWSTPENDTPLVDTNMPVQTKGADSEVNPINDNAEKEIPENNNLQSTQLAEKAVNDNTVSPTVNEGSTQNAHNGVPENGTPKMKPYSAIAQQSGATNKITQENQRAIDTPRASENVTIVDARTAETSTTDKNTLNIPDKNDRSLMIDPSKSDVNATSDKTQDAVAQQINDQEKPEEKKSLIDVAEAIENAKTEDSRYGKRNNTYN